VVQTYSSRRGCLLSVKDKSLRPVACFMRRAIIPLMLLLMLIPTTLAQEMDSVVDVTTVLVIGDADIGIEEIAISPDGEDVLLVGIFGYAHLISSSEPIVQVELNTNDDDDLKDVDWHPQGLTALIAGNDGTLLRYTRNDHSVGHVAGSTASLMGSQLTAVTWDSSGNWAYIGDDNGLLTRFREDANGYSEYFPINGTKNSEILDISCLHKMHSVCVVATQDDGLALIDQEHELHWLTGSEGNRWFSVECPHPERERCYAVGKSQSVGVVELNSNSPSSSYVLVKKVEISGEFVGIHARDNEHLLLQTAPFGWVDWEIMAGEDKMGVAFPWLGNSDVQNTDPAMAGESLVGSWSESSEVGFGITSYGRVVKYYPPSNTISENLVSALAPMFVIITVPGVVLGLIYISSPKLQKKYLAWSNARRVAKREARKQASPSTRRRKK
jgi:WD40 repeat protein